MKAFQNISLVQINVEAGVEEYYLPKNVAWKGARIERLQIVVPTANMVSPVDGKHVLTEAEMTDLYFDLYAADDTEVCHSLHFSQLRHDNNHPYELGLSLSLSLSRLFFSDAPQVSGCILLYVYYNCHDVQPAESTENITIRFPLAAGQRLNLDRIINDYMHANNRHVKSIICWGTAPVFLTLRSYDGALAFTDLCSLVFRAPINGGTAQSSQAEALQLDNIDLDFDNCFIHNTTASQQQQVITFAY